MLLLRVVNVFCKGGCVVYTCVHNVCKELMGELNIYVCVRDIQSARVVEATNYAFDIDGIMKKYCKNTKQFMNKQKYRLSSKRRGKTPTSRSTRTLFIYTFDGCYGRSVCVSIFYFNQQPRLENPSDR